MKEILPAVLLLLIVAVRGRILRLGCLQYANFDVIYSNGVLQGSVIATFAGLSSQQCEEECIAERECKSINSENNGARACELNSKSTADPLDGVSLNSKEGWTYKSTSYNDRLVGRLCKKLNPCEFDQLCTDTCYCPGYSCHPCDGIEDSLPCQRKGNIALGKQTWQSSTYRDYTASDKAVDGNRKNNMTKYQSCACTMKDRPSRWKVDLVQPSRVVSVKITNRLSTPSRLGGFTIRVGYSRDMRVWNAVCIYNAKHITGDTKEFKCTTPITGRFLSIELVKHDEHLTICEVEVFSL